MSTYSTDGPLSEPAHLDDQALVSALGAQGVHHLLLAEPALPYTVLDSSTLIAQLAGHTEARLREALIPLFLRHPELAEQAPRLIEQLDPAIADMLRHLYTAAVYLQRLWLSTLRMYLGSFPLLPDHFGQSHYHLPAPNVSFGEAGLRSLASLYAARTGYDWLSVYHAAMNIFLQQLSLDGVCRG